MCGIWGIYNFDSQKEVKKEKLNRMGLLLEHRGPDNEGTYINGNSGLGNKRLSIIDDTHGRQPMCNEDKSIWVTFNGEIYNFLELKDELEAKGHRFRTESDTEVIIHTYEEYGQDCIHKFEGMFAFALLDLNTKMLFLVRDRFGIKPLFYVSNKEGLAFSSEINSLLQTGMISGTIDFQALHDFLSLTYIPAPRTIYKDIRVLLPGHWLVCTNGSIKIQRYWRLAIPPQTIIANRKSFYYEQLLDLIKHSVKRRLQADVPIGALLSGGIDSSLIVAFASRLYNKPLKTFTVGCGEKSYDERKAARLVSRQFGTEHYEYIIGPDSIELLPRIIRLFGQPYADSSALAMFFISKHVREHVKVILCGDGGDEIFGGYDTYNAYIMAEYYRKIPGFIRKKIIPGFIQLLPTSFERISFDLRAKSFLRGAEFSYKKAHYLWKVVLQEKQKRDLYSPELLTQLELEDSFSFFERYFKEVTDADPLNQLFFVDLNTFMPNDNLMKVDIMSMAYSLEARVPFLNHMLVQDAFKIPSFFKVRGLSTKLFLRKACSKILPKEILNQRKKGFTIPFPKWIRNQKRQYVLDVLSASRLKALGFFKTDYVNKILDDHFQGRCDYSRAIISLMSVMLWNDQRKALVNG